MARTPMNYEDRLLYVTRNFVQYGQYDKNLVKASRIVKKYFPGKSTEECHQDMERFVRAYDEGILFVEANKADYWKEQKPVQLREREKEFYKKHPTISEGVLYGMIYWIFNWYHER